MRRTTALQGIPLLGQAHNSCWHPANAQAVVKEPAKTQPGQHLLQHEPEPPGTGLDPVTFLSLPERKAQCLLLRSQVL